MDNAAPSKPDNELQRLSAALESAGEADVQRAKNAYWQYRRDTELEPLMRWCNRSTYHKGDADLLPKLAKAWQDAGDYLKQLPETASARERADAELAEEKAHILYTTVSENYALMLETQRLKRKRK